MIIKNLNLGKNIEIFIKKLSYLFFRILFRNKNANVPVDISKMKKILIFRYDRLGDMLVTIPAARFIKSLNPDIKIDIIATPKNSSFIRNDNTFNKIYLYDGTKKSLFLIVTNARMEKYDAVFCWVFTKSTFAGLISNLIARRKPLKITYKNQARYKLYSAFFNVQIPAERNEKLMALMLLDQVKYVFGTDYNFNLLSKQIIIDEIILKKAENLCSELNLKKFIFYNISAGIEDRCFSIEKNLRIIELLVKKLPDTEILLHYSPEDEEKAKLIAGKTDWKVIFFPTVSDMLLVSAVIKMASLVVTPDTSIVHIAASFDVPTIAFYSNKDNSIKEWLPLSDKAKILIAPDNQSIEEIDEKEISKLIEEFNK